MPMTAFPARFHLTAGQREPMLRDARLKKFDQLLVYRLDRLGRDTRLDL